MSKQTVTIVPVSLQPEHEPFLSSSQNETSLRICTIQTANAEITFYDGVNEHVIQTVMRELKDL